MPRMSLKIWITGPHSCGKTSLGTDLALRYHLPFIRETARDELSEIQRVTEAKKPPDLELMRAHIHEYDRFQRAVFQRQLAAEAAHPGGFLSDRALWDIIIYANLWSTCGADMQRSPEFAAYLAQFPKTTDKVFDPTKIVLFVAPELEMLKEDGTRERPTLRGVDQYYGAVEFFLAQHQIRHVPITTPHQRKRLAMAAEVIDRALLCDPRRGLPKKGPSAEKLAARLAGGKYHTAGKDRKKSPR